MYLALSRSESANEDNYGFHRPDALLVVVILSDEADCSANKSYPQIFDPAGNKVFWSDPGASTPTSAVCWNAGVTCSGDPSGYDSCDATNKDIDGNEGVADADAVLHPMSRYAGLLDELGQQSGADPVVAVIGGAESGGGVFYSDVTNTDPAYQEAFGIGPGCEMVNPFEDPNDPDDDLISAVPPARMRALAEASDNGGLYTICDTSLTSTMQALGQEIVGLLP
jgi:hypothetical protein